MLNAKNCFSFSSPFLLCFGSDNVNSDLCRRSTYCSKDINIIVDFVSRCFSYLFFLFQLRWTAAARIHPEIIDFPSFILLSTSPAAWTPRLELNSFYLIVLNYHFRLNSASTYMQEVFQKTTMIFPPHPASHPRKWPSPRLPSRVSYYMFKSELCCCCYDANVLVNGFLFTHLLSESGSVTRNSQLFPRSRSYVDASSSVSQQYTGQSHERERQFRFTLTWLSFVQWCWRYEDAVLHHHHRLLAIMRNAKSCVVCVLHGKLPQASSYACMHRRRREK